MKKNRAYREQIRRIEEEMQGAPDRVMRRALLYGFSGYLWLLVIDLLTTAFVTALVSLFLHLKLGVDGHNWWITGGCGAFIFTLITGALLKTSWVRIPLPDGYRLDRSEAPDLFDLVEDAGKRLGAPPIHGIFLDGDYNAAMASRPRFGLIGFPESYLILGYPFLQSHTRDELHSVIGHEIGHMMGQQGRLHRWLYRLGMSWGQLAQGTGQGGVIDGMLPNIARSYSEGLFARSVVIARHYEFAADQSAVRLTSPDTVARALFRLNYNGEAMNRQFWPAIWRRAAEEELPPKRVYELLEEEIRKPVPEAESARIRRQIAARRTVCTDTHPCLRERLQAVGAPPPEEMPPCQPVTEEESAVGLLTAAARRRYLDLFSNEWKAGVISSWREKHEEEKKNAATLRRLREKAGQQALSPAEEWEKASLELGRLEHGEAVACLRRFLLRHREHPEASYQLGEKLLADGEDGEAVPLLRLAAERSTPCRIGALALLAKYYERQGRFEELEEVERRMEEIERQLEKSRYERGTIFIKDVFRPHALKEEEVSRIRRVLARYPKVLDAWVAQKAVQFFSDVPCHVLLVRVDSKRPQLEQENLNRLMGALYRELELDVLIAWHHDTFETPRGRLMALEGSRVHPAGQIP